MANKAKGFTISQGRRESGADYWIVRGTLNGRQERKEFSDYAAAKEFQELRNAEVGGFKPRHNRVLTSLAPDELEQAESFFAEVRRDFPNQNAASILRYFATISPVLPESEARRFALALRRLNGAWPSASLADVCDYYCSNRGSSPVEVKVEVAAQHYLADALRRYNGGTLGKWQFERIGQEMQKLIAHHGSKDCRTISTFELDGYLTSTARNRDGGSEYQNKTWNNRRGILNSFFAFCQGKGWLVQNPVSLLKVWRKAELPTRAIDFMSAKRSAEIMEYVETNHEARLVPYFAITLFAGLRPAYKDAEITRFQPEWVIAEENIIDVPAWASKVKKKREIVIQPNLRSWLDAYPLTDYPVVCPNFRKLLFAVRRKFEIKHDELRHTYCTMLVGQTRSVANAALQAGNSEAILWSHYLNIVKRPEAERFWSIIPKHHNRARS